MNSRRSDQLLTRPPIFTIAFLGSFLFLLYLMLRLLTPFSASLLWAGIIAFASYPLYRGTVALFGGRTALDASLMALITLVITIGPAILLLAMLVSPSIDLYHWAAEGVNSGVAFPLWNHTTAGISSKILRGPLIVTLLTALIQTCREEFFEQENPD